MRHTCPVCAYALADPPTDFAICPCCGTEFGLDDFEASHDALRRDWLARGAPWFSRYTQPPRGWSPLLQLLKAGLGYEVDAPVETFRVTRGVERVA